VEIDIEKLKDRASEIRANLEKIRYYASLKDQDFWADERNIYSVKYLMLEAIEAAGAICIHILAKKFQQPSSSFAECFEALYDHQVIDQDLSAKLRRMARFRNILVHRYWDVDDQRVLKYARENLSDFEDFLKGILKNLVPTTL